jgi:hypothetical protein
MKSANILLSGLLLLGCASAQKSETIDRKALLARNNPHVESFDSLASLSVGNGEFAFTVDASGLQTFPELYDSGVPLGTQSQWGWHSFANTGDYRPDEALREFDFHGHPELYACQFREPGRQHDASEYLRANPHRLHLGQIGLTAVSGPALSPDRFSNIDQRLNLADGTITSSYRIDGKPMRVVTVADPDADVVALTLRSPLLHESRVGVKLTLPYPTGKHVDDACDWSHPELHTSRIVATSGRSALIEHTLDSTRYYIRLAWQDTARLVEAGPHDFRLIPAADSLRLIVRFSPKPLDTMPKSVEQIADTASAWWNRFWSEGAVVDFSRCTDPRAAELERRVVLSQYLLAIQCAGSTPPQETGLTYNSWYGKFHLEMHWWHAAQFALWGHPELLERSMGWYRTVEPVARRIAERQGFDGVRWMKMTDPSGREAPSNVGSFLIWQQPHFIYMAELLYRANLAPQQTLDAYKDLVDKSAEFMASFVTFDSTANRYILKGAIPAQETLAAATTVNPPFELAYWHYALGVAQQWRERTGEARRPEWDKIIAGLSTLAFNDDSLYLAAENALDTYEDIRYTSDHMAVLGALGILPQCRLVKPEIMDNTLDWVMKHWNWDKTWGWDYPMTAMCATRLGRPDIAVDAILMPNRTNTYLLNGHNYQDDRLRIYLPGNGGLLTTIALMCAGWDGATTPNPGFPKDGTWDVRWEGLKPLP